jgi:hypothetical protein
MPDVLANRIGGGVDPEFPPKAAGYTTSTHAGATKSRMAPHGG